MKKRLLTCILFLVFLLSVVTGQTNRVLFLKNQTDQAVMPSPFGETIPNEFTVEWWMKPNSFDDYNQCIGGGSWGTFRCHTTKSREIYAGTYIESRFEPFDFICDCSLTKSWQHLAFAYKRGTARLYLNGVLVASKTGMKYPRKWDGFFVGFFKEKSNMSFDGLIDDIRIWDVARKPEEIAANKMTVFPKATPHLKAYYNFEDTSNDIVDHSGNNLNGIRKGCRFVNEDIVSVDFKADKTRICVNDTVSFLNLSVASGAKSRFLWQFSGGEPEKSSAKQQKVVYTKAGYYDVSLSLVCDTIKLNKVMSHYIKVLPGDVVQASSVSIVSVSNEELNNAQKADRCIDGDKETFWSSGEEKGGRRNHEIIFKLSADYNISGVGYLPRQDGFREGAVKHYKIYVSEDPNVFGSPVCEGKWDYNATFEQFATFDSPVKGRYLKFEIIQTIVEGTNLATCSEFTIYHRAVNGGFPFLFFFAGLMVVLIILVLYFLYFRKRMPHSVSVHETSREVSEELSVCETQNQVYNTVIRLFGGLSITYQSVDYARNLYPKLKHLFVLICIRSVESPEGITRKEIEDTLWGVGSMTNASKSRANNTQSLKNALSDIENLALVPTRHSWVLNYSQDVYIDYEEYVKAIAQLSQSIKSGSIHAGLIETLLDLIGQGEFLQGLKEDWIDDLRNKITFEIIDVLTELLGSQCPVDDSLRLRVCDVLFQLDDLDEAALRTKVAILNAQNKQSAAKKILDNFKNKYRNIYNEEFKF